MLDSSRCLVVAEVGLAHDGSLRQAHAFIDAAAYAGADAVKFQTHLAEHESTHGERWRVAPASGETRYQYWLRTAFTEEQWRGLAAHAHEVNLRFWSSTFCVEAVALLQRVGVDAWKVASGEITHQPHVLAMAETRLPVFVSTGMATWNEIRACAHWVRAKAAPLVLLECASAYPSRIEDVSLANLQQYRGLTPYVGLSDHSGTIWPALGACVQGAAAVEVHLRLEDATGPDASSSLTVAELGELVTGVRVLERWRSVVVDPTERARRFQPMRDLFLRKHLNGVWLKRGA